MTVHLVGAVWGACQCQCQCIRSTTKLKDKEQEVLARGGGEGQIAGWGKWVRVLMGSVANEVDHEVILGSSVCERSAWGDGERRTERRAISCA